MSEPPDLFSTFLRQQSLSLSLLLGRDVLPGSPEAHELEVVCHKFMRWRRRYCLTRAAVAEARADVPETPPAEDDAGGLLAKLHARRRRCRRALERAWRRGRDLQTQAAWELRFLSAQRAFLAAVQQLEGHNMAAPARNKACRDLAEVEQRLSTLRDILDP
jgi:hypothetical protein